MMMTTTTGGKSNCLNKHTNFFHLRQPKFDLTNENIMDNFKPSLFVNYGILVSLPSKWPIYQVGFTMQFTIAWY